MEIISWRQIDNYLPVFDSGETQLFYARLDEENAEHFLKILSPDECARAERFVNPLLAHRFITAHGVLRHLLGQFLEVKPERLVFQHGARGKPFLGTNYTKQIFFNLSHSEGLAVYAFAGQFEVGVDIEKIHTILEMDEITASYFSQLEQTTLMKLPSEEKISRFFRFWTCKEAVLKAAGYGFGFPSRNFTIDLIETDACLSTLPFELTQGAECQLTLFYPGDEFVGALAHFKNVREVMGNF